LFEPEYAQLFRRYPNCFVVKENDFHSDFLNILNQVDTKYILFGIDDVVYFDAVDFAVIDRTFDKYGNDIFGFSLRFSPDNVKASGDTIRQMIVGGQTIYSLDWTKGRTPTTRYPFELCASIYRSDLVREVISNAMDSNPLVKRIFSPGSVLMKVLGNIISTRSILKSFRYFYSPNTLESWNCRWCQNHNKELPSSLYFQKLCASAIQVNLVNTSTKNTFDGSAEYTVEALNSKYKQGYKFDIDYLVQHKPQRSGCGKNYFKLSKQDS
jgi:hypothetical protein